MSKRFLDLRLTKLLFLITLLLLILYKTDLTPDMSVEAQSLKSMPLEESTLTIAENPNERFGLIEESVPGTVIPGEYVLTLKNESTSIVQPSNVTGPTGIETGPVLQPNETALESSVQYLENRNIDVLNTYNFNESGVSLVIKTPDPVTPIRDEGSLSNTPDTGTSSATEADIESPFSIATLKQIFAPAAPTSVEDLLTPITNASEFCEIAENSNIATCEPSRRGGIVSSTIGTSENVPVGIQRIGADKVEGQVDLFDSNVVIVVMDTGVTPHPDLNLNTGLSKSFIGDDIDNWNHGTHVAGVAAAKDNTFGVKGVAPGVEIISVKVLDNKAPNRPGGTSSFLAGIQYITGLAQSLDKNIVVNLSITLGAKSPALNAAVVEAVRNGVVFVAAAGNNHIDAASLWPGSIEPNNAIVVSAVGDSDGKCGGLGPAIRAEGPKGPLGFFNADDSLASVFSNTGQRIDLSAPGVSILSTSHDSRSYHKDTGTSMAAPHVTGGAALYIINNPNATPLDIKNGLIDISVPSTSLPICSGNDFGYFTGDTDGIPERMFNVGRLG